MIFHILNISYVNKLARIYIITHSYTIWNVLNSHIRSISVLIQCVNHYWQKCKRCRNLSLGSGDAWLTAAVRVCYQPERIIRRVRPYVHDISSALYLTKQTYTCLSDPCLDNMKTLSPKSLTSDSSLRYFGLIVCFKPSSDGVCESYTLKQL